MSDDPTQPTPEPSEPAPATEPTADTEQPEPEPDPSEAAKYRRRLRAAEKERDELAGQLDSFRRSELARVATTGDRDAPRLYAADDLFGPDYDLSTVLDDTGRVDADRVRSVITEATENRRHLRADLGPRPPRPDPAQGSSGHGHVSDVGSWADALSNGRRG